MEGSTSGPGGETEGRRRTSLVLHQGVRWGNGGEENNSLNSLPVQVVEVGKQKEVEAHPWFCTRRLG